MFKRFRCSGTSDYNLVERKIVVTQEISDINEYLGNELVILSDRARSHSQSTLVITWL